MKILMCLQEEEASGTRCFQMALSFLRAIITDKKYKLRIVKVWWCSVIKQHIGHSGLELSLLFYRELYRS